MKVKFVMLFFIMLTQPFSGGRNLLAAYPGDTTCLRLSIHVFSDSEGMGNFSPDSSSHLLFLEEIIGWVNHRLLNLDTLSPEMPSPYIGSTGLQVRTDSLFFHRDDYAWDCSQGIDSYYMRQVYVDRDSSLNYRQKYLTLPVFLGDNYSIIGGHNSFIGDKSFIAMRGFYSEFLAKPYPDAVRDCGRGLLHELCHSLGLSHNFRGGHHGEQCDECDDNGCPQEGTSNNIMDYWPGYGYALSECQMDIIKNYLNGNRGNIADVICNDSCYSIPGMIHSVKPGNELVVTDTLYLHGDLVIEKGGRLTVEGYLSVPSGAGITVMDGAEFIVVNGTLGNLCGELWNGIQYIADGQGRSMENSIIMKNGIIENAKTGIQTYSAGNIRLDSIFFRNNIMAIDLTGGEKYGQAKFNNCLFETSRRINEWETGFAPEIFMRIDDAREIILENCIFINHVGHRLFDDKNSGIGILAVNSGLDVRNCRFENLYKGLYAGGSKPGFSIKADSCYFSLCHAGMHINKIHSASVNACRFSVNRLNTTLSTGIYAEDAGLLDISNSFFISDYGGDRLAGIVVKNNIALTHLIHDNSFELLQAGIMALYGTEMPGWPGVFFDGIDGDLLETPLGTLWSNNKFKLVPLEHILVRPDGRAICSGKALKSMVIDPAAGRNFNWAGFSPFANHSQYYTFTLPGTAGGDGPGDISFFVMSDSSYISIDSQSIDDNNIDGFISWLAARCEKAKTFPEHEARLTHKDLVELALHIESFPWITSDNEFKEMVIQGVNGDFPVWFRRTVMESLKVKDPWKTGLRDAVLFIAGHQLENFDFANKGISVLPDSALADCMEELKFEFNPEVFKLDLGASGIDRPACFSLAPNPNNGEFGIRFGRSDLVDFSEKVFDYRVWKLNGGLLASGQIRCTEDLMMDFRPVLSGSYLIEIWRGDEFLGIQKFIILSD